MEKDDPAEVRPIEEIKADIVKQLDNVPERNASHLEKILYFITVITK